MRSNSPTPVNPLIPRRSFLKRSAATLAGIGALGIGSAAACKPAGGLSGPGALPAAFPGDRAAALRVIAYNIYKGTGWPKDGERTAKAYEMGQLPARLARELALYEPDIINFSESPPEPVIKEISVHLNMDYVVFPSGGNWPGTLLSRLKILESANAPLAGGQRPDDLFTRHWGRAILELPGGESLTVHSAHLYPHDTPEAGAIRKREIEEILRVASEDIRDNKPAIVMGDLNHTPLMPEYSQWINAGWTDTFTQAGRGDGMTIPADEPSKRIDYVLAGGSIAAQVREARPLFEGAFRTNPADPGSFALSDHLPQYAQFNLIAK